MIRYFVLIQKVNEPLRERCFYSYDEAVAFARVSLKKGFVVSIEMRQRLKDWGL